MDDIINNINIQKNGTCGIINIVGISLRHIQIIMVFLDIRLENTTGTMRDNTIETYDGSKYNRDDIRNNDRQKYRSGYNKDNRRKDLHRTENYSSERLNERDDKPSWDKYSDSDYYYKNGWHRNCHSY